MCLGTQTWPLQDNTFATVFFYVWDGLVRYFRNNIINWKLHTFEFGVYSEKTFNINLIHI